MFGPNNSAIHSDRAITSLTLPDWALAIRVVFFALIFTFGVPGNTVVLLLQARNKSKTSTDWLVTAMAGTDLCGAGASCSLYVVLSTNRFFEVPPSSTLCQGHFYCIYVTSVSSALLLCAVAVDRFSKVCRPHSKLISIKRAKLTGVITMVAVALAYTPSFVIYEYDISDQKCGARLEYQKLDLIVKLSMALVLMILFSLTIFSYINIAVAIRKLKLQKKDEASSSYPQRKAIILKRRLLNQNKISPKPSTSHHDNVHDVGISKYDKRVRLVFRKKEFFIDKENVSFRERGDLFCDGNLTEGTTQSNMFENRKGKVDKSPNCCTIKLKNLKMDGESSKHVEKELTITKEKANTTTKIMFLLTVLFIMTWLLNILSGIVVRTSVDNRAVFIIFRCLHPAYLLNFVSNPLLYVCLSSKYRSGVYRMFCIR